MKPGFFCNCWGLWYRIARVGTAVVVLMTAAPYARADWVEIQKPYSAYGHLYNTLDGTASGQPVGWCAATACVNSFRYLENSYHATYDNRLTGGDLVGTRNALAVGWISPGSFLTGNLTVLGGRLRFPWDNGANPPETVTIGAAYSEIPEPATLSLLALGGLLAIRRRR